MTQETTVLDADELTMLLAVPNKHSLSGCRNYALMQFMAQTGLRCAEALAVEPKDIREETWKDGSKPFTVTVLRLPKRKTKGKRDRMAIPLTADTVWALEKWLEKRESMGISGGPLFCTITDGKAAVPKRKSDGSGEFLFGYGHERMAEVKPGAALSTRYVRQMVARYAQQAGINGRVHPHMLRHTALTNLYEKSNDLRLTQLVAGHSTSRMTERYTHVRPVSVARAFGLVSSSSAG